MSPMFICVLAQGLAFDQSEDWEHIVKKATAENKYIFVDCFTTWCGPCKAMEKNVYNKDTVGRVMNDRFICVKLQVDSTQNDNGVVQSWYTTAHKFELQYHIGIYPTYLFFSPNGEAVHKAVGYLGIQDFLLMSEAAIDPAKQYYYLLSAFQKKKMDFATMPYVARYARDIGEETTAFRVAADYMQYYIAALKNGERWTRSNIAFINSFKGALHLDDQVVTLFWQDRKEIDSVMQEPTFSDRLINNLIYRQLVKVNIDDAITGHFEPSWRTIYKKIRNRFGHQFAEKNVVSGKVDFYRSTKMWSKYSTMFIKHLQLSGIDAWPPGNNTAMVLDNDAYEIFKYSTNRKELEIALTWINRALIMELIPQPEDLDTKANLLYKLGRTGEGLSLEAQSHSMAPDNADISEAFRKMKNGLPTWPTE